MPVKKNHSDSLSLKQIALLLYGKDPAGEIASSESREAFLLLRKAVDPFDPFLKAWLYGEPSEDWGFLEQEAANIYCGKSIRKAKFYAGFSNAHLVTVNQKDFCDFINTHAKDKFPSIYATYEKNPFWECAEKRERKKSRTAKKYRRWYERAIQLVKEKNINLKKACKQIYDEEVKEGYEDTCENIYRRVKAEKEKVSKAHLR